MINHTDYPNDNEFRDFVFDMVSKQIEDAISKTLMLPEESDDGDFAQVNIFEDAMRKTFMLPEECNFKDLDHLEFIFHCAIYDSVHKLVEMSSVLWHRLGIGNPFPFEGKTDIDLGDGDLGMKRLFPNKSITPLGDGKFLILSQKYFLLELREKEANTKIVKLVFAEEGNQIEVLVSGKLVKLIPVSENSDICKHIVEELTMLNNEGNND